VAPLNRDKARIPHGSNGLTRPKGIDVMSETITVEVKPREETGKNANRRLRRDGEVPGVVYGLDKPPFLVSVSPKRLGEILHLESGRNTIFSLSLVGEDQTRSAMIKDLQRDPITELFVHVDFVRLDLEKMLTVRVPVHLVGVPDGVKNEGGVVDHILREVVVECLPKNIPEHVDVDVSALHINQNVAVSDIPVEAGVRIVDEPESVIAVVVPPRAEVEAVAVEGEVEEGPTDEEAEPEVIKKGKEGEEGASESSSKSGD
jgi:large subunit ribosomal protein L25